MQFSLKCCQLLLRKQALLLFVCLISVVPVTAQICTDSVLLHSVHVPGFEVSYNESALLSNGNRCQIGSPLVQGGQNVECLVYTVRPDGTPAAAKRIYRTDGVMFNMDFIAAAPNGGVLLYGTVSRPDPGYERGIQVVLVDSDLNVVWAQEMAVGEADFSRTSYNLRAMHCDADGFVYLSFYFKSLTKNTFFVCIGPDGNMVWNGALNEESFLKLDYHEYGYINAATTIGNKVFFLGPFEAKIGTRFNNFPRPGIVGFAFDKVSGRLLRSAKLVVPYTTSASTYNGLFEGTNNAQLLLYPSGDSFSYLFGEFAYRYPVKMESNLIHCMLDTAFNAYHTKKIKRSVYSLGQKPRLPYALGASHSLAFTDSEWNSGRFAVVDSAGNTLLSKAAGTTLHQPVVLRMNFINEDKGLALHITDSAGGEAVQAQISDLAALPPQSCLGKDTLFFKVEPVELLKEDFKPDTVYTNQVVIKPVAIRMADHPVQSGEACKVLSVCSSVQIAGDTSFCTGEIRTFVARKNEGCYRSVYLHPDTSAATVLGRTDSSVTVRFGKPWSGYIKAVVAGCTVADSVFVTVHAPQTAFSLGPDGVLCSEGQVLLQAPANYKGYQWSTGDTAMRIVVNRPAAYAVSATDFCGNIFSDTVLVRRAQQPFIAADTSICRFDTLVVNRNPAIRNYQWQPAEPVLSSGSAAFLLTPAERTRFSVQATDTLGCVWRDDFWVDVKDCAYTLYFPNVFTPNGDGLNDAFGAKTAGLPVQFSLRVYDRWGGLVFQTNNPADSWKGTIRGAPAPQGIYVYVSSFKFRHQQVQTAKGTVLLLKN